MVDLYSIFHVEQFQSVLQNDWQIKVSRDGHEAQAGI